METMDEGLQTTTGRKLKIAITGPESTGKSSLAEALALKFGCAWVPEYAREYLNNLNRPYTFEDIAEIARGQQKMILEAERKHDRILFCDTELLVTLVWSVFRFGQCDPWISSELEKQQFDLYLLCDIDLPWEEDPLREHPDRRQELFEIYRREITRRSFPYFLVSGTGNQRTASAAAEIFRCFPDLKPIALRNT